MQEEGSYCNFEMGALARIEQEEEEIVGEILGNLLVGSDPVGSVVGSGLPRKLGLEL